MMGARARFAYYFQAALVVTQAMIVVGFVGTVAIDPDPGHVLPFLSLVSYLLVLSGAALIFFRREHAEAWREQITRRMTLPGEREWLLANQDGQAGPWYLRVFGVRPIPESFGRRGAVLVIGGLLISTMAMVTMLKLAS